MMTPRWLEGSNRKNRLESGMETFVGDHLRSQSRHTIPVKIEAQKGVSNKHCSQNKNIPIQNANQH